MNPDELAKHGLTPRMYMRDLIWKGNSTLPAEELQAAISWKLDDLIASIGWKTEGDSWIIQQINETKHQWTSTTWSPFNWGCFKLDLQASKKGSAQLKKFTIRSKYSGGLKIFVHQVDQVLDKNLRDEMDVIPMDPSRYENITQTHYPGRQFDVSLKVIKTLSTSTHPCSQAGFDSELVRVTTEKMMKEAGCTVPYVDRVSGAPICEDVQKATKAIDIWDNLYNKLDVYGREDVPPPCEFFIPTIKEQTTRITEKRGEITTMQADLRFKSQVNYVAMLTETRFYKPLYISDRDSQAKAAVHCP